MESDEQLLERFLEGDEAAFEQIVERHEARLRNVAFGFVRDRGLAEDIAQDGFLQAYRKAASFRRQGPVRNWLYRIIVNRARDELRRVRRRGEVAVADPEAAEQMESQSVGDAEAAARASELRRHFAGALSRMREQHRTPLVLRDVEGLTYSEIADLLDWPLGTVQTRIHRGRLELRALLGPDPGSEEVTRTCEELSPMLSAHLDGELAPAEESVLGEHLAGCGACRTELAALRELAEGLAVRTEPDPFFVARFRALRDSDPWAKPEPWRRLALRLLPFAAAAVLGAFAAVWVSQPRAALGELESRALGEASLIAFDTEADPVLRIALEPFPETTP